MTRKNVKPPFKIEDFQMELERTRRRDENKNLLRTTMALVVTAIAITVLVSMIWLPLLKIHGSSMEPTLKEGEIIVFMKTSNIKQGDVIAFYYNNKILVKRAIAFPGQWVEIDEDGNVYVDQKLVEEPYLPEKAKGECDIILPYQVPQDKIFVMGDHRSVSMDSRNEVIGCISNNKILGKLLFPIWPL